ncbi:hypothetical protein BDZ94DRAFT_1242836 [Collybia nuda]|uniref:Uncharacterized protein n=1 Tax=Collybia nuda TaxID=64659 RepID=A0A9P5YJ28_9AGAR|nr:hypothetical protein BDZ94DRAFT_1242836 [Collybia nuda]
MPGGVNPYPKFSTLPSRHVPSNEIHANTEAQAMSMFRASPWVPYDPTPNQPDVDNMDDEDMDAPQISTLREEETPPPQKPKGSSARRGKSTKMPKTAPAWPKPRKESHTEEEEEAEDEEDQLIDDDDDEMMKPLPPAALPPSARSADATPKRKAAAKRKPRKSGGRIPEDEKKARDKDAVPTIVPDTGASMTWFPAAPSEKQEEVDIALPKEPILPKPIPPKKPARKAPSTSAPRPKAKISLKLKTAVPILADDVGVLSEGHTATAASSPHIGDISSDIEPDEPVAPVVEEMSLEGVPLPQYPLPSKPFPVQLPPKIATGFAPVIPLDKSGKKVRHWRVAHREIRGIAGGRWFARSWVGEKESEFGSAAAAVLAKGGEIVTLPKLSGSISAPVRGSKGKTSKAASSLAASAAPSRDGSSVPDIPVTSARPPTKMRTILAPPSDAGDSDMTGVAGS